MISAALSCRCHVLEERPEAIAEVVQGIQVHLHAGVVRRNYGIDFGLDVPDTERRLGELQNGIAVRNVAEPHLLVCLAQRVAGDELIEVQHDGVDSLRYGSCLGIVHIEESVFTVFIGGLGVGHQFKDVEPFLAVQYAFGEPYPSFGVSGICIESPVEELAGRVVVGLLEFQVAIERKGFRIAVIGVVTVCRVKQVATGKARRQSDYNGP